MTQTEYIVNEAFQEFHKKYDKLFQPSSTTSVTQVESEMSSSQNVGRLAEPRSSSLSVTDTDESPTAIDKKNKFML